jgi:hypothetical protein
MLNQIFGHALKLMATGPGSGVGQSVGAGSPFNDYVAGVAIAMLLVTLLVVVLLLGAFWL